MQKNEKTLSRSNNPPFRNPLTNAPPPSNNNSHGTGITLPFVNNSIFNNNNNNNANNSVFNNNDADNAIFNNNNNNNNDATFSSSLFSNDLGAAFPNSPMRAQPLMFNEGSTFEPISVQPHAKRSTDAIGSPSKRFQPSHVSNISTPSSATATLNHLTPKSSVAPINNDGMHSIPIPNINQTRPLPATANVANTNSNPTRSLPVITGTANNNANPTQSLPAITGTANTNANATQSIPVITAVATSNSVVQSLAALGSEHAQAIADALLIARQFDTAIQFVSSQGGAISVNAAHVDSSDVSNIINFEDAFARGIIANPQLRSTGFGDMRYAALNKMKPVMNDPLLSFARLLQIMKNQ